MTIDLQSVSSDELVSKIKTLCTEERRITAEILSHLAEVESRRLYAEMGYSSLFEFAVKELRYSEGAAGRRIAAMRMMKQVPDIEASVRSGELNITVVSIARRATEGRSIEEKREVLELLTGQSQREAERTLAARCPQSIPREKERVLSNEATQVTFAADPALMEKFEKLRGLLSHKNANASDQELFHLMADELLKRLDPEKQQTKSVTPVPEKQRNVNSRYVPREVRREIWRKAGGRCEFVDARLRRRCSSRHLLQIDHRVPFALGGATEMFNLRLLCRSHNLWMAERAGLIKGRRCDARDFNTPYERAVQSQARDRPAAALQMIPTSASKAPS